MLKTTICTLTLMVFVLPVGPVLFAQEPSPTTPRVPGGLKEGQWIRVRGATSQPVEGRFEGVTGDSVRLVTDSGERTFVLTARDTVWVRGRAVKTGTIFGAVLLVPFGVALGAYGDYNCGDPDSGGTPGGSCPGAYAVGVATTGVLGGLIGAGVGALVPKWHRRP